METKPKRNWLLPIAAFCVFVALLAAPATRWIVKMQVSSEFMPPGVSVRLLRESGIANTPFTQDTDWEAARMAQAAARRPDRFDYQLASAGMRRSTDDDLGAAAVARHQNLVSRFPNEPALYAAILRYQVMHQVRIHRQDENLLAAHPEKIAFAPEPLDGAAVASFDASAEAGESRDPDNAFFPMMLAIGQFAVNRDAEAMASIHRAAEKPRYDDYAGAEFAGLDALQADALGRRMVIDRVARSAAMSHPEFGQMRSMARLAIGLAMVSEQQGNMEAGFTARMDVMRLGDLIRAQSRTIIGSLVAIAIMELPTERPGGEPPAANTLHEDSETRRRAHVDRFCTYLQRIGHGDAVNAVRARLGLLDPIGGIVSRAEPRSATGMDALYRLITWWAVGILLAANVIWMLVFVGVSRGLLRFRLIEGRTPAMALYCTLAVAAALLYLSPAFSDTCEALADNVPWPAFHVGGNPLAEGVFLSLVVPVLTMLVSGIVSLVRKSPVSTGMVRGLNAVGVPVACVLVFVYAGVVIGTARQEAATDRALDKMMVHEGRYMADLAGTKWPGVVKP